MKDPRCCFCASDNVTAVFAAAWFFVICHDCGEQTSAGEYAEKVANRRAS